MGQKGISHVEAPLERAVYIQKRGFSTRNGVRVAS
jgi:hypothetical protein